MPFANRTSVSPTSSGRSGAGIVRMSLRICVSPSKVSPTLSSLASYRRCWATVPTAPATTPAARTDWKPPVNDGESPRRTAASTGPSRKAVRRTVSVLAKPAASRDGAVACLTTANVAPRPNDFHACANKSPTNTHTHGWTVRLPTVIGPIAGAASHTANPSVDNKPNSVSADRDPTRSEIAPPGYG